MAHDIEASSPEENFRHFQGWNMAQEEKIMIIESSALWALVAMVVFAVAVALVTFAGDAIGSKALAYGAAAGSFAGFWTFFGLVIFRIKD